MKRGRILQRSFLLALAATILATHPGAAQSGPERPRSSEAEEAAWRQYEGFALAIVLAGCFEVRHQSSWDPDAPRYPDRFELSSREFTALGYHRMGTFETDMSPIAEGAIAPIWRAVSLDEIYIDPDPSPTGEPSYQAFLTATTPSDDFVLETYWLGESARPGDDPLRGRLVGRAYGARVECDPVQPGAGPSFDRSAR